MKRGKPKPLGATERKVLLVIAVFELKAGRGPTVTELRRAAKLFQQEKRGRTLHRLRRLRTRGLVLMRDDEPHSLRVTPRGRKEALRR